MRKHLQRHSTPSKTFLKNNDGVIDLPIRLLVSIIIGTFSLAVILTFIFQQTIVPQHMVISISPLICSVNDTHHHPSFSITVSDENGQGIANAQVILKGSDIIDAGITNQLGETKLSLNMSTENYMYESYIDVMVKHPKYTDFFQGDMIKIIHET